MPSARSAPPAELARHGWARGLWGTRPPVLVSLIAEAAMGPPSPAQDSSAPAAIPA